jgi:cell division protein FtsW (lipid II flippase)
LTKTLINAKLLSEPRTERPAKNQQQYIESELPMILIAILFPTIYLLIEKKWGWAALTAFLFILGCILTVMSFGVLFIPALIIWAVASVIAIKQWKAKRRYENMRLQAEMNAEAMRKTA